MYQPMQGGYPQAGHPQGSYPQNSNPQGGYPPPGAVPPGSYPPSGGVPQGGYPPAGAVPQGGYPPAGAVPQGGYPPAAVFPQGGYFPPGSPPQGSYPQQGPMPGVYLPQGGISQPSFPPQQSLPKQGGFPPAGYPPQPGFPSAYPSEGYNMPPGGPVGPPGFDDDIDVKGFDFNDKSIRRAFIRKVYAILMAQLMVTLAIISLFTFHAPTKLWVMRNPLVLIVALVALIVCLIAMACCDGVRRKSPMNLIFLSIFTLAESFLLGVVSIKYDKDVIMMAVGITAAICFALTVFAMQTRFDFTVCGGGLFCALIVLMLFGLIAIFIPGNKILLLVYASAGALLFSLYLVYDTQLMMGGEHKYSISPEEYIFAALNLYLDIINIFLFILRIIGAARG